MVVCLIICMAISVLEKTTGQVVCVRESELKVFDFVR